MSLEQKMEVFMLPTENTSHIRVSGQSRKLEFREKEAIYLPEMRHLYVCSDREIKKQDIVCHQRGYVGRVTDTNYNYQPEVEIAWFGKQIHTTCSRTSLEYLKKVEATTNTSISIHWNNDIKSLPNIPIEFIQEYVEKYNQGDPIREVSVEMFESPDWNKVLSHEPYSGDEVKRPVVRPDNTIIISKVEETWDVLFAKRGNFKYWGQFWDYLKDNYSVPTKLTK
jgi:hypothetical protein